MRRRSSWILVSSLAALVAIITIAAKAAVPPNVAKTLEAQRRLAAERPQDPAVFNDLGNLLVMASRAAEAEAAYRKAIELDPDKTSALFNLGLLLQQRGELREALQLYRRTVKVEPRHAWAHYQLGSLYEFWDQDARAVDAYARAFALDPQLAFPAVNPHIVENQLVTEAMMRAYRYELTQPQAPRVYDDPTRIANLLEPPPAASQADKVAGGQQPDGQVPGQLPGAAGQVPQGTVLREQDLNRGPTAGQAGAPGAARGVVPGTRQSPTRTLREWNRPEPTIQEVPGEGDPEQFEEPGAVITPPPGGVYYRPGVQSTGRLNLQLVPERKREGRG